MKKKITSLVLSILMVFSILPISAFTAFAAELPDDWADCTACSAENPHIITTKAELNKIREHVKTEGGIGGYFKLGNDIVFETSDFAEGGDYYRDGAGWLPIGHNGSGGTYGSNNGVYFDGSFDGNGFAVSGLYIFYESNWSKYNGLFAMLGSSAHIFDLTLKDFDMQADVSGALAGMVNSDNVLIENVTVDNCNMKHWNDTANASGLLIGKLQGKSTVQNIVIKNSVFDSNNQWRQGWIAGLIQGTKINNVSIENCSFEGIHASGLLAHTIRGGAELSNITINDSTYIHTYHDDAYFIASEVSEDIKLSNITMNLTVTGMGGDNDNNVMRIDGEKSLFGTQNVSVPMENVNLNIAYDMTDTEKGTEENGSLKMRIENDVIYVSEATNELNRVITDGNKIIAYTNGGTFANSAVFANGALTTPVKENHFFEGWFTDSDLTTALEGAPVAGSSYYAKWDELAEREFVVTTNKNSVIIGETVDVVVTLNGTELIGAEWTLDYDKTKFELVSCTLGEGVIGTDGWAIPNGLAFAPSQVLATYTLKAIVTEPNGVASAFTVVNCEAFDIRESIAEIVVTPVVTPTEDVTTVNPDYVIDADSEFIVGKKLVLVHTNSADISFSYASATMYKMIDKYAMDGYAYTFAIVVDAETYNGADVAIVYAEVATKFVLTYDANDYDLNDSGDVNLRDVSIAYSVLNGNDYTYADYMNIVLNADINADGVINGADTGMFVNAYSNAN